MAPSPVIQRCLAATSSGRVKLQGGTFSGFCVPAWSSWSPTSGHRAMFDV